MTHDVDKASDASLPRPDNRSVRLMLLLKLVTTCNTRSYYYSARRASPRLLTAKEQSSSVVEGGVYVTAMLLVSPDASDEYRGVSCDTAR